ncbi:MAG: IS66 family transposase [Candidatus Obscuribacterales bacterium]
MTRKRFFGSSSEKDASKDAPESEGDCASSPVIQGSKASKSKSKPRGQQPGSKGHGRTERGSIPTSETITLEIESGCKCSTCGKGYRQLTSTEESSLYEIQVELYKTQFERLKYVSVCECEGKKIVTAPPPAKLYPRTDVGISLWTFLAVQKFLHGVPTSRTLKDLSLSDFELSEGTVTGGFKVIDGLLTPLYEALKNHCRGASNWNADETTWRVFSSGRKRWWLWLIASDDAVVHILDPSRSRKVPTEFFAGSSGTLMTDRFSSYKPLGDHIQKALCWVHQRRDFVAVMNGNAALAPWAKSWLKEIGLLFVLNLRRFRLWEAGSGFGGAWDAANEKLAKHVKKLERRWQRELKGPKLHRQQKAVLNSMKKHWPGLTLFLSDPRIPLDNNRAERLLRNAVILRKNSYGSGSEWAGHMAAKFFSLFQTWLINDLNPQAMLMDYFEKCSETPGKPPPNIADYLPWTMSDLRKKEFALPKSYKKPK